MDLFHRDVAFGRQTQVLGLHVDDHQHLRGRPSSGPSPVRTAEPPLPHPPYRVGAVALHEFVDGDVVLVQLRAGVVPADDPLASWGGGEGGYPEPRKGGRGPVRGWGGRDSPLTFLNIPYMFSR